MKKITSFSSLILLALFLFSNLTFSQSPTVQSVTSFTDEETLKIGDQIEIKVIFSEAVTVTGTPQLTLETGSTVDDAVVDYSGGSGDILNFIYTVVEGHSSSDLDYKETTSLVLNGGSIKAVDDNSDASLTLVAPGSNGSLGEAKNYVIDGVKPTITGTTVANDNSTISVTFSEAVYNTDGGNGALEAADFAVTIAANGGPAGLTSATPTGISSSNGNVYTLTLATTGTATGVEVYTVVPVSTSIYDAVGNVAATSQENNTVTLNDVAAPTMTITAAEGADGFTSNDATIALTFTSSEATTNFTADDITVAGGSLGTLSGNGTTYTATFTPTGSGATTIDVAADKFTDAVGNNNTAATQFNWTYDGTVPTITASEVNAANTKVTVTFNEAVYKASSGSGDLEVEDFVFSISGGTATLASATPTAIAKTSQLIWVLDVNLNGTADGSETLTVSPASTAIYDANSNAASTSQSNNTVTLNDLTAPTMTITAAEGADGFTSNDATIALTFTSSEATTNFTARNSEIISKCSYEPLIKFINCGHIKSAIIV